MPKHVLGNFQTRNKKVNNKQHGFHTTGAQVACGLEPTDRRLKFDKSH